MSKKNLAARALQIIYRYWSDHDHGYPTSSEIANALDITVNHWDRVRADLVEQGYLKREGLWGIRITGKGLGEMRANDLPMPQLPLPISTKISEQLLLQKQQSINELTSKLKQNSILPDEWSQVPLFGQVKAGSGARLDDLIELPGDETIGIPHQFNDLAHIGTLEVQGVSMVHENVFPGDYVIFEKVDFLKFTDNDLVIVRYLPEEYNQKTREDINLALQDHNILSGPTLKYFFREARGDREPIYRLSWKTEAQKSEFKIHTRYIDPNSCGRVIAVYRPESFRLIKTPSPKTQ